MTIWEKLRDPDKEFEPLLPHQYYLAEFGQKGTEVGLSVSQTTNLSLSPDARWAVALQTARTPPPMKWGKQYLPFGNKTSIRMAFESLGEDQNNETEIFWLKQFVLLDLNMNTVEPLLNAPSGLLVGGNTVDALTRLVTDGWLIEWLADAYLGSLSKIITAPDFPEPVIDILAELDAALGAKRGDNTWDGCHGATRDAAVACEYR